jgi:hypothetical protein
VSAAEAPLDAFTVPLGAGGFGVVKAHATLDAAAKFIRSAAKCDDAKVSVFPRHGIRR